MSTLQHEGTKDTKNTKATALLISHRVIGAAIEVHRLIGPGLLESVYEAALSKELRLRGLLVERQIPVSVTYKGEILDCQLKLDLLVEGTVLVELKAVDRIIPVHRNQLLTYLRLRNLWLGLLVNCNVEVLRDGIRRVLNG
jgi:GxxExxY protein